jgi:hypothetical protein
VTAKPDYQTIRSAMSTQLIAITIVLLLAIGALFAAAFAISAARLSSHISASERQAEILAAQQRAAETDTDNA